TGTSPRAVGTRGDDDDVVHSFGHGADARSAPTTRRRLPVNETQTTVRGTILTDPITRRVGTDQVFTFRVASHTRYLDRTSGEWKTGGTLYFSASCWGTLAQRTAGRLFKGDAVLVHGRLLTNEYEKEGRIQRDLEMRVNAIGPDMSRMEVTAKRIRFYPVEPVDGRAGESEGDEETGADAMEIGS